MERILYNEDNLTKDDITEEVGRIKVLLFNDNNEILVAYCNNIYQYIGGHLEDNEDLITCLNREVEEETGIKLNISELDPFLITEMYSKDWPKKNANRNSIIRYYAIKTNQKIDYNKINLTEYEKSGDFRIRKINLDEFEKVISDNYNIYESAKGIGTEMINAMKVYKKRTK
ncbi:MAG: NUDIX hydrolase [Bacilli bacterium]|nr:NUDIX hydrolase [Bacilli bacterium]